MRERQELNLQVEEKHSVQSSDSSYLGRHILAEFFECNSNILNNIKLIEEMMEEAAIRCGATVVTKTFHKFSPFGISGVIVISESHLTIHTWPENGYAAVDLFTCGESCDPEIAYEYLKEGLMSTSASYTELKRGFLNQDNMEVIKAPFQVGSQHA